MNEVIGTTNDFDNTPWCTKSGSCQATSSQIPRTCCKFVTQDTYQNASNDCYALLTPGTFKNVTKVLHEIYCVIFQNKLYCIVLKRYLTINLKLKQVSVDMEHSQYMHVVLYIVPVYG